MLSNDCNESLFIASRRSQTFIQFWQIVKLRPSTFFSLCRWSLFRALLFELPFLTSLRYKYLLSTLEYEIPLSCTRIQKAWVGNWYNHRFLLSLFSQRSTLTRCVVSEHLVQFISSLWIYNINFSLLLDAELNLIPVYIARSKCVCVSVWISGWVCVWRI